MLDYYLLAKELTQMLSDNASRYIAWATGSNGTTTVRGRVAISERLLGGLNKQLQRAHLVANSE